MTIFTTRTDLVTWLHDAYFGQLDEAEIEMVAWGIQDCDQPAWGDDWGPWLSKFRVEHADDGYILIHVNDRYALIGHNGDMMGEHDSYDAAAAHMADAISEAG